MPRKRQSNYKLMACFDIETNNDLKRKTAYAVTYQLSILKSHTFPCNAINNDNVNSMLDITIDRQYNDICKRFDELIMYGKANGIVPVVMVHNLAFEMWVLSPYISRHESDGCSKSTVKPLTINIKENGENVLVFWDTLTFWQKGLEKLGDECKYPKLSGCWDYAKQRTPDTPLTDMEIAYAKEDVIVPWAYMGYYLRLNPEIDEHDLACKVLTKTSVVRYKSTKRCGNIHMGNKTLSYMWYKQNRQEKPKTDYELEITHASTRGGFTYCSMNHASKVFHKTDTKHILKYDANSMHICHALSHYVPFNYRLKNKRLVMYAFEDAIKVSVDEVIKDYHRPFCTSFFAKMRFTNVRLKKGTIFKRDGISTFASSRFSSYSNLDMENSLVDDNEGGHAFKEHLRNNGWKDTATCDAEFAFGKFYGASEVVLILNELSAWEFAQQFEWDDAEVIGDGYITGRVTYATDKSVLSFNTFYKHKTEFKKVKGEYDAGKNIDRDSIPDFVPDYLANGMAANDSAVANDVESFYLSVKGELNSLYGIEATNEAKNEIILTKEGYEVGEYKGADGLPNNPKAWYQYGTHIVGWSRIHQILFMLLLKDKVDAFICGDTDSHKIYTSCSQEEIESALKPLHDACSRSLEICTERARKVKEWYPMNGLGYYESEGEADAFCASWNKSYIQYSHGRIDVTMAGVPCNNVFRLADGSIVCHSYNRAANHLHSNGWSFDRIAELFVGYNVYISHNITGLNQRKLPKWNTFDEDSKQPKAILIYPMNKAIGCTDNKENRINSLYAKRNNPNVNTIPTLIDWDIESDEPTIVRLEQTWNIYT